MQEDKLVRGVKLATAGLVLLLPTFLFRPVSIPVTGEVIVPYVTPGFYWPDLFILFILGAGLVKNQYRALGRVWVTGCLLGLGVLAVLSVGGAISPLLAGYTAIRWLLAFNVYLWFCQGVVPAGDSIRLFIVGLAGQAIIGLLQVLAQHPLGLPGELALLPQLPGAAILEVAGLRWLRAYGLTFHPNVLGGFLAVGLILGIGWLDSRPGRVCWWLMWLGLFLSFSRSAWLAAGVGVGLATLLWLLRPGHHFRLLIRPYMVAGLVLVGSGLIWHGQLITRLQPLLAPFVSRPVTAVYTEQLSISERLELLQVAQKLTAKSPWRGIGAGNFSLAVIGSGAKAINQPVHNVFLMLAAEVGLLGGLLWGLLWLIGAIWLIRHGRSDHFWSVLAGCAWLILPLIGLADFYPWGLESGRLLTAMVLGLSGRQYRSKSIAP